MEIKFRQAYLKELYETGTCSDKKHRFQPQIVSKYRKTVDLLEANATKEDLYRFHSLRFEALRGDKEGLFSVRVNDQYRLELSIEVIGQEPVITVCTIEELSNHYK
ncbi:MAG: type II toxin-antitoxin system RelE/ParE family toxin [Bacteroidales bacterium]|nr:type II toxin-antitoxin system RelE/ParE family toxin [Candidatus Liminaster caballi]